MSLPIGRYLNLFLYGKAVGFVNVADRNTKRFNVMVQSMGGTVKSSLDPGIDLILTSADHEIKDGNTFYDRTLPLVRTAWLDALWSSHDFVDPITFSVRGPRSTPVRGRPLQTPVAALRKIPGDNRAEVLRKRDATVPITQFLPLVERKPSRQAIQEILAELESEKSDSPKMEALCREIRGSPHKQEKPAGAADVSVAELETFTQVPMDADEPEDALLVRYDAPRYGNIEPRPIESDPLLWLLS
jgi:hypothetical protein